jgi:hypothetical protein
MRIGVSINEAIDWTQDRLMTTRPMAERTLFSLLAEHRITETEAGFMLVEDEDENEKLKKTHNALKTAKRPMQHRPRSLVMQKNVNLKQLSVTEAKLNNLTTTDKRRKRLAIIQDARADLYHDIDAIESGDGELYHVADKT